MHQSPEHVLTCQAEASRLKGDGYMSEYQDKSSESPKILIDPILLSGPSGASGTYLQLAPLPAGCIANTGILNELLVL